MSTFFMIFVLSLAGFLTSWYLHSQYLFYKRTRRKMACLVGRRCTDVIASRFGTTLGVKNEVVGLWYYGLLLIASILTFIRPVLGATVYFSVFSLIFIAAMFSVYLLYIQTRIIRRLCFLCFVVLGINAALLLLMLATI